MIIFAIVSAVKIHKVKPDSYLILNSTATYNDSNNLNINVMVRNHTNRIRLPTGEVEQAKIMYLFQPPRKGYDN